jgi:hypothetical protein
MATLNNEREIRRARAFAKWAVFRKLQAKRTRRLQMIMARTTAGLDLLQRRGAELNYKPPQRFLKGQIR